MSERRAADPTAWSVGDATFLRPVLDAVDQPVWVLDRDDVIRFANPAAVAAFGYDDLAELLGRRGHDTVHYKRPDGSPYPVQECRLVQAVKSGRALHDEEDCFVRRDGSTFPVRYSVEPLELPAARGAVVSFTDMEERRRVERALRERDIAEAREAELRLARRRSVEAGDAARRRLTRDLHDGAQQRFVVALINLQRAQELWSSDPAKAKELLDDGVEDVMTGTDELREFAISIHPRILSTRGLHAALDALAARMPLPVTIEAADVDLPPAIEATAYFFVSEGLTNVIKHAQAASAAVRVAVDAGRLTLEVRDDGVDHVESAQPGSGLVSLRDRVAALDGELLLISNPSAGTTLRATIPLAG